MEGSDLMRGAAIGALVEIEEPAVKPLIKSLKDRDYLIRGDAVGALGNIGDKRAVEPPQ